MVAPSVDRVERNTDPEVNARIRRETELNIARLRGAPAGAIRRRLDELDREWDIERSLEANAASFALAGLALGTLADRRFLLIPAAVAAFLLQHALQGWCPPVPFMRRLGFRTRLEIEDERRELQAMLPTAL